MNTETRIARKLSDLIPGSKILAGVPEEVILRDGVSLRVFSNEIELRNCGTYESLRSGMSFAEISAYAVRVAGLQRGETIASTARVSGPWDAQRA